MVMFTLKPQQNVSDTVRREDKQSRSNKERNLLITSEKPLNVSIQHVSLTACLLISKQRICRVIKLSHNFALKLNRTADQPQMIVILCLIKLMNGIDNLKHCDDITVAIFQFLQCSLIYLGLSTEPTTSAGFKC